MNSYKFDVYDNGVVRLEYVENKIGACHHSFIEGKQNIIDYIKKRKKEDGISTDEWVYLDEIQFELENEIFEDENNKGE